LVVVVPHDEMRDMRRRRKKRKGRIDYTETLGKWTH